MSLVSLVIPIYNDLSAFQKNVYYLLECQKQWSFASEILVVDDGSHCPQDLYDFCQQVGVQHIALSKNFGKGEALRRGVSVVRGDVVAFTDADVPYQMDSFEKMVQAVQNNQCEVAVGARLANHEAHLDRPRLRRWGSWLYRFFLKSVFGLPMVDPQSGLKVFRGNEGRRLFARSTVKGFAIDSEILLLARQENMRVGEFPIVLRSKDGASVRLFYHGFQMLFSLLDLRRRVS